MQVLVSVRKQLVILPVCVVILERIILSKIMRILIGSILLSIIYFSCVPTYIDRVNVRTRASGQTAANVIHIKRVFIFASGNNSTRFVATNLYSALKDIIEGNGSKTEFDFKNVYKTAPKAFISTIPNGYDGYMIFYPKDTSYINFNQSKFSYAIPIPIYGAIGGTGFGNSYNDSFVVQIYNDKKELIYTGEIAFHFDPTNETLNKKVAQRVIDQLSKSNIQFW